jgi:hypothetical protein
MHKMVGEPVLKSGRYYVTCACGQVFNAPNAYLGIQRLVVHRNAMVPDPSLVEAQNTPKLADTH